MSFVDAAKYLYKNENLDKFIFKLQMNCVTEFIFIFFVSQDIKLLCSR